jgi:methyl-accepting chemotaxis protein
MSLPMMPTAPAPTPPHLATATLVAMGSFLCVVASGIVATALAQPAVGFVVAALSVPLCWWSVRVFGPRASAPAIEATDDKAISDGSRTRRLLDEASSDAATLSGSVLGITRVIENLSSSIESSSSSVAEMSAIAQQAVDNSKQLGVSVSAATRSLESLLVSVDETSRRADTLAAVTRTTVASMDQLGHSTAEAEKTAVGASSLSTQVRRAAERGGAAMGKTLEGVALIRASALSARNAIVDQLNRIASVRQAVVGIREIAEQTNVMAVHAAAEAQAAVDTRESARFADRVKELAARITTATIEITDHLNVIGGASKTATTAILQCERRVEVGADLSTITARVLADIGQSAETADAMIHSVAVTTVELSRGFGVALGAVATMAGSLEAIRQACAVQRSEARTIAESNDALKATAAHVELSIDEQNRSMRHVNDALDRISANTQSLHTTQAEQSRGTERLIAALQEMRRHNRDL